MITQAEIREKAYNHWRSRRFLRAELEGMPFFPLSIPFRRPVSGKLVENFKSVKLWLKTLRENSREHQGYGYDIEYAEINHRTLGPQRLPARIVIPSKEDYLELIGKKRVFGRFQKNVDLIAKSRPGLREWVIKKPGSILANDGCWTRLLRVVDYFLKHPRPERYLRELDIPDVDSKFVEQHKKILSELLDQLMPSEAINNRATGLRQHGFERRYGLKYDEQLIRFRLLDSALAASSGFTDLSIPLSEFCFHPISCRRVIITENKMNGLTFPRLYDGIVIFGLGYGVQSLADAAWLHDTNIFYWGDIDTHGFGILSRLRTHFPQTRSFLMDRATLIECRRLWGNEDEHQRCLVDLSWLTDDEDQLYDDLRFNRLGKNIRLEQERIAFSRVKQAADIIIRSSDT